MRGWAQSLSAARSASGPRLTIHYRAAATLYPQLENPESHAGNGCNTLNQKMFSAVCGRQVAPSVLGDCRGAKPSHLGHATWYGL